MRSYTTAASDGAIGAPRIRAVELGGARRPKRVDLDLGQATGATQDDAELANRVAACHVVAPVGGDEHDRHVFEIGGEAREQLDRCAVGPLEVVDKDRDGSDPAESDEPRGQRFDQCRRRCRRWGRPVLRQDQ